MKRTKGYTRSETQRRPRIVGPTGTPVASAEDFPLAPKCPIEKRFFIVDALSYHPCCAAAAEYIMSWPGFRSQYLFLDTPSLFDRISYGQRECTHNLNSI